MNKYKFSIFLFLLAITSTFAQTSVASIFSDNIVLQQNVKIPICGFANASEKIIVKFHNQTQKTVTNKEGKWSVYLDMCSVCKTFAKI